MKYKVYQLGHPASVPKIESFVVFISKFVETLQYLHSYYSKLMEEFIISTISDTDLFEDIHDHPNLYGCVIPEDFEELEPSKALRKVFDGSFCNDSYEKWLMIKKKILKEREETKLYKRAKNVKYKYYLTSIEECLNMVSFSRDRDRVALLVPKLFKLISFAFSSLEMCSLINHLDLFENKLFTETCIPKAIERCSPHAIRELIKYEINDALKEDKFISLEDPYLISLRSIGIGLCISEKDFLKRCNYYTGGLLEILDLEDSYITGSCIPACLVSCLPGFEKLNEEGIEKIIDLLYPSEYTIPEDLDEYRKVIWSGDSLKIVEKGSKVIVSSSQGKTTLRKEPGADIDIAVNKFAKDPMSIVNRHIECLRSKYPETEVSEIKRDSGSYIWEIKIPGKRIVQIYISSVKQICLHHVSMVRGLVTGNGKNREIYLSATAIWSHLNTCTYNYYYFAGKTSPVEILLKYRQRGYGFGENSNHKPLSSEIMKVISEYAAQVDKWKPLEIEEEFFEDIWSPTFLGSGPLFGYGNFSINSLEFSKGLLVHKFESFHENVKLSLGLIKDKKSGKRIKKKFSRNTPGIRIRHPKY